MASEETPLLVDEATVEHEARYDRFSRRHKWVIVGITALIATFPCEFRPASGRLSSVKSVIIDDKHRGSVLFRLVHPSNTPNRKGPAFDNICDKVRRCSLECSLYTGYSRSDMSSLAVSLAILANSVGSLMWASYSGFCE
jgi:hypothetical protein